MTHSDCKEIANNIHFPLNSAVAEQMVDLFKSDAENGTYLLLEEFALMYDRILRVNSSSRMSGILHTICQTYLQSSASYSLTADLRACLCVKNSNYYASIGALAECVRYVNQVLELTNVSDDYILEALVNIMKMVSSKTMKSDVLPYVERFGAYTQTGKLTSTHLVNLYMGLIEVYITLGMTDIYESIRPLQKAMRQKSISDVQRMGLDLRILAGDLILLKKTVTGGHIETLRNIVNAARDGQNSIDTSAGCLIMVLNALYDYLEDEEIIDIVLIMIGVTSSNSERLRLYEYLDENLHIDKQQYVKVYNAYYRELK